MLRQKHILFDYDGVLIDTFTLSYDIFADIAEEPVSKKEYQTLFTGNTHANLAKQYEEDELRNINHHFFDRYTKQITKKQCFNGIPTLIKYLHEAGYMMHIVSSSSTSAIISQLEAHDMKQYFYEILGYEFNPSKVEKINYIQDVYQPPLEDMLFVTDTTGDLKEAHEAGILAIAVTWGFHSKELLNAEHPDYIVSTIEELRTAITDWNN